jgi:two-component system chemotaxis response regulator CheY
MRAMIVDDSRAMRTILGSMLRDMGFETGEAIHGQDALLKLRAVDPPALILLDWNMPEMNGLEVLQKVRANRAFDGTRIMMVTTETEMSQMLCAMEAGADEYVMKPFTKEVIREKLQLLRLFDPVI